MRNLVISKSQIEAGADLEIRNNLGGTALYNASFFCRPEIVKLLLQNGADKTVTNQDGLTALEVASSPWTPELENTYRYIYRTLKLELDLNHIKQTRQQIAELLRE